MFSKIKTCTTAKEIWEKLAQLYKGNDETKENKLTVAQLNYESIKMREGKTMTEFDERFISIVIELTSLGKEYTNIELSLKVMNALPREWDVKTMAMRESKDLNKLQLHDLFANLKAYEFELETRSDAEPSTSQPTKALAALVSEQISLKTMAMRESKDLNKLQLHDLFANLKAYEFELETRSDAEPSTSQPTKALAALVSEQISPRKTAEQLSNDVMSLFVKKFGKFMIRTQNTSFNYNNAHKSKKISTDQNCYNYGRPGHFEADCKKPKKDDKRSTEKRRNRLEKRPNKKNDRKVLVAEERNRNWADSDYESTSSSSSSESEQEEVHFLMANQTTEDEDNRYTALEDSNKWYLDSGCARHMTGNPKLLSDLTPHKGPRISS
ncbi:hypothetical protein F511_31416 [Dorcoceras hygrometricum]|uniref:CCHC-type domain-containing protein n=1 Tax=Dorcoceras hygrometricum TaxID=472368 RepID=A0A2Z7AGG5_9LAMI|nr:hypothetical protein F511_31416 [Dorcoceras hygrometricum]